MIQLIRSGEASNGRRRSPRTWRRGCTATCSSGSTSASRGSPDSAWAARRPKLRIVRPEPPRETAAQPRPPAIGPTLVAGARRHAAAGLRVGRPRGAARRPARRGPRQDRPRGPRSGLTDDENRILQEASRRARNRRSDRAVTSPAASIRDARPDDRDAIVGYNLRLASETESKSSTPPCSPAASRRPGRPDRLRYWVAERRRPRRSARPRSPASGATGVTAGSGGSRASTSPPSTAAGASSARSTRHVRSAALAEPDVIGLRLYVEQDNDRAQRTYEAMGMVHGGYHVYEELWKDRFQPGVRRQSRTQGMGGGGAPSEVPSAGRPMWPGERIATASWNRIIRKSRSTIRARSGRSDRLGLGTSRRGKSIKKPACDRSRPHPDVQDPVVTMRP